MGAAEQLLMDDHARFDGLAQTYLIGQQHARGVAMTHFMGDIELVRDQADLATGQTASQLRRRWCWLINAS